MSLSSSFKKNLGKEKIAESYQPDRDENRKAIPHLQLRITIPHRPVSRRTKTLTPPLYFYVQQRQPQMTAVRFPLNLSLLPDGRRSPSPLAQFVNQVGTTQMNCVLAEFLSKLIGHMVEVFYLFRLNRIVK